MKFTFRSKEKGTSRRPVRPVRGAMEKPSTYSLGCWEGNLVVLDRRERNPHSPFAATVCSVGPQALE